MPPNHNQWVAAIVYHLHFSKYISCNEEDLLKVHLYLIEFQINSIFPLPPWVMNWQENEFPPPLQSTMMCIGIKPHHDVRKKGCWMSTTPEGCGSTKDLMCGLGQQNKWPLWWVSH